MRPKGKLFALLAIFAAIGVVTATGAFTTVTASRTATANVSGDSSALLALEPYDGPNGNPGSSPAGYAQITGGTLEINLDGYNNQGQGVNLNALTDIQDVFVITNQGTQKVKVNITDSGDNDELVTFYNVSSGNLEGDEGGNEYTLGSGDSVVVSIEIDTEGESLGGGDELIDGITVSAEATS